MENNGHTQYSLAGQQLTAPRLPGGLYLVATPIGNLDDITIRALQTLAAADVVACEDTRTTRILLNHYAIKSNLLSYNDRSGMHRRPELMQHLAAGKSVALVSDAGTPLISDPGFDLVREALAANHRVLPLPGPSAALAAVAVSGCATDRFVFAGFLPTKVQLRQKALATLRDQRTTAVIFESPNRILSTLDMVASVYGGDHYVSVSRELTKLYESQYRGSVRDVHRQLSELDRIRGELVLVVDKSAIPAVPDEAMLDGLIMARIGALSIKELSQEIAAEFSLPRRQVYQRALALSAQHLRDTSRDDG